MYKGLSQRKDSHRLDTTASLTGTSLCTYAIEPPCTERYARWCERSGLFSPSYSIRGEFDQQGGNGKKMSDKSRERRRFLDETSRTLFSGDTANVGIILMRQPNNGTRLIEQAHDTMAKLWAIQDRYDRLGVGHDATTVPKQIVKDYLDLTTGLLDGTITGQYEETGFRKGDVARLGMAELWYQCDQ